jgi:polyferredoxin
MKSRSILTLAVFLVVAVLLTFVQLKVDNPLLILERFFNGGGWVEIFLAASYGGVVAWFMYDPARTARWRQVTWLAFSFVFFSQLLLGVTVSEKFLMTGELHLPIPMMIMSGPIYRGEFSVMTILFVSTIVLSGPAWCSHFCYFGALDGWAAGKKKRRKRLDKIWRLKIPFILTIVAVTILLRILAVDLVVATLIAIGFGVGGLAVMLLFSRKKGQMVHCLTWCPIGTIVSGAKYVNPIRLTINDSCTSCMLCTSHCKYNALKKEDIMARKPASTCTLCGDCVTSCHAGSLQYKLFNLKPAMSRNIYLGITITLHAMTMVLAKI